MQKNIEKHPIFDRSRDTENIKLVICLLTGLEISSDSFFQPSMDINAFRWLKLRKYSEMDGDNINIVRESRFLEFLLSLKDNAIRWNDTFSHEIDIVAICTVFFDRYSDCVQQNTDRCERAITLDTIKMLYENNDWLSCSQLHC